MSDVEINVSYTNWRGETSVRRVILSTIRFGTTEWHPEPTWLIYMFDLDHPSQLWKEFDLKKCDFDRNRADMPPTTEQIMADPRVQALVDAAKSYREGLESAITSRGYEGEDNMDYYADEDTAIAQIKKG
jgi:hypothetical protein